jgi:hypothetical protein
MRAEKNNETENFERKTHTAALYVEFPSPVLLTGFDAPGGGSWLPAIYCQ